MRAACWHGPKDIRVEDVPDPVILNPRDAIVRITSTAICGSDLHLYNGFFPTMKRGDIMGHEFMGEVVEVGSAVKNLREGDRVVVPFLIACGGCFFCKRAQFSCCDNSNPNQIESEAMFGYPGAGLFGYSHLTGGYAGGQAELARVPFADVGPIKIPEGVPDEKVLFLSDILPTGWMGAVNCGLRLGDTVAVWGCGPVGQMAIRSLFAQGAERVIAIDRFPERLDIARRAGAETIHYEEQDVYETLHDATAGRGPDSCLDAVGMEAHGVGVMGVVDRVKQAVKLENDRPAVLRQMIRCVRKGGTISLLGVYSGMIDKYPMGVAFNKGVTFRMGQADVQKYTDRLLEMVLDGRLTPEEIITDTLDLEDASTGYKAFNEKRAGCLKVVMKPNYGVTRRPARRREETLQRL